MRRTLLQTGLCFILQPRATVNWIHKIFDGKAAPEVPVFDTPLIVDRPMAVIGDVHGRDDLLARLLDRLDGIQAEIVFVGDLCDRGENSQGVFEIVASRLGAVSLMGNHERMMLDFIEDPATAGRRWLRNGGLQTLASFGIGGLAETSGPDDLHKAAEYLADGIGPDAIAWLRARPLMHRNGNVAVVHAMTDPGLPIDAQVEETLLWRRPSAFPHPRRDGIWTVHGHTVVDQPTVDQGRIAIDTGAFATGKLSAVLLRPQAQPEFIQA